jgi:hypothetical protein
VKTKKLHTAPFKKASNTTAPNIIPHSILQKVADLRAELAKKVVAEKTAKRASADAVDVEAAVKVVVQVAKAVAQVVVKVESNSIAKRSSIRAAIVQRMIAADIRAKPAQDLLVDHAQIVAQSHKAVNQLVEPQKRLQPRHLLTVKKTRVDWISHPHP